MTDFSNGYTEYPVTIFNGGAEEGTTAGWVNEVGDLNIAGNGLGSMAPHSGTYYFMGTRASVNNTLAYNQVDLLADSTLTALQIDSGVAKVRLQWYQGAYRGDPDEYITAGIRTRESAAGAITKTRIAALAHVAGEVWRERSVELVLPVGTRFIDVCIKGQTYNGDHCDAYIDDLKLDAYIAQDVVEPPPDPTVNTADLTDVTGRLWEGNNNVKTTTEDETNPLALEIDRSGRYYIDTGRDQDLCITQNGLTATMWVNHKTVPTRATERQGLLALYEVGKQDTDQGWGLSVQWVGDGPKYVFNTGNETLVSAATVTAGVWAHVAVIAHPYDAVTPAKVGIYVTGTLDTEWEVANYPLYEAGAFNVGRDSRLNNVDEPVLGGKEPVSDTIDITTDNGKVVVSNRFPEVSHGGSLTVNYAGDDELRLYGLFDNMFDKDGYVEDSGLVLPKDGTITLDVMFDAVIGDYNNVILYAGTEAIPAKNGISSIGITVVEKQGNYTEGGSTSRIGTVLEAAPVGTDVPVVAVIGNTPDYIPPPSNPATNGYFQLVLHKAISGALTETATSGWSEVTEEVIGDWKAKLYVGDSTSYTADETITLDATAMVGSLQTHSCFADFSRDTEANVRATYKVARLAKGESYTATNGKVTKVYYAISDDGADDAGLHIAVPDGMSVAHSRGSGSDGAKYRCFYTLSSSSTVPDEEVTVGDITFDNTDPSTVGDMVIIEIEYSVDVGEVVIPDPSNPVPEEDYYAYADAFIDDLYVYQGDGWVQSAMSGSSFTLIPRTDTLVSTGDDGVQYILKEDTAGNGIAADHVNCLYDVQQAAADSFTSSSSTQFNSANTRLSYSTATGAQSLYFLGWYGGQGVPPQFNTGRAIGDEVTPIWAGNAAHDRMAAFSLFNKLDGSKPIGVMYSSSYHSRYSNTGIRIVTHPNVGNNGLWGRAVPVIEESFYTKGETIRIEDDPDGAQCVYSVLGENFRSFTNITHTKSGNYTLITPINNYGVSCLVSFIQDWASGEVTGFIEWEARQDTRVLKVRWVDPLVYSKPFGLGRDDTPVNLAELTDVESSSRVYTSAPHYDQVSGRWFFNTDYYASDFAYFDGNEWTYTNAAGYSANECYAISMIGDYWYFSRKSSYQIRRFRVDSDGLNIASASDVVWSTSPTVSNFNTSTLRHESDGSVTFVRWDMNAAGKGTTNKAYVITVRPSGEVNEREVVGLPFDSASDSFTDGVVLKDGTVVTGSAWISGGKIQYCKFNSIEDAIMSDRASNAVATQTTKPWTLFGEDRNGTGSTLTFDENGMIRAPWIDGSMTRNTDAVTLYPFYIG